ncbi:MAG TPA: CheR family methyltransferase, partial [Syntrophobacteria bacterium]|nr:CheR family methyltransferase [Syntrophobacteria bacterium]
LIGVTEFFRQPQAWEVLEQKVIAPLVEKAPAGSEIRIWVPGCSTGQEVYSLAMLLAEHVEKSGKKLNIQTFATDSDAAALAAARSGRYSKEEIGKNLSPARLKRYFERKDGFYQVVKAIRSQVVFAPQNITADPPFSRLDLISCRNLLIYLDQEVQKKIIALCHFALREGGFLFLGTAESVGDRDDLFAPVSKKWRVYRRIGIGRPVGVEIPIRPVGEPLPMQENLTLPALPSRVSLASMAQQVLLDRFAPACVMIDRKLQVVYVHGAVEEYLTFPPGELTTRVVDMARDGLRARLRGAIGKCLETNRPLSVTARVRRGQKSIPVKATVNPLRYPREADGLLLITFEDYRAAASKSGRGAAGESGVQQLEDELKVTREELQSTIEQLEASNDQLKASNEEVTAANEELQSANEEMETSKEELQSLNEELNTINARLHEKVEELENINNDIVNLLSSTNIATVFLDKELNVRSYTPASTRLFSLIPSDAGRPIADVLRRFTDETMLDNARHVLADLTPLSKEVQAEDGGWYIRRITPYRTKDDRIEGVVVTFVDVCDLKATEDALRRHQADLETARAEAENARRRLAVIVDSIADGFFAFDREWRITHVNDSALRHYRKTREEMVGRDLFEVFPAARGTVFEAEYRRAMGGGEPVHFEAPSVISDRIIEIHAYPGPDNMTVLFRDV